VNPLRAYIERLRAEAEAARKATVARDAWLGEWHAHPLALADESAVERSIRRTAVERLTAEMAARFARRAGAK
jgi:hypothetical protein